MKLTSIGTLFFLLILILTLSIDGKKQRNRRTYGKKKHKTKLPTCFPVTLSPTESPTKEPVTLLKPTESPTGEPTYQPTEHPTGEPTKEPVEIDNPELPSPVQRPTSSPNSLV